MNLKKYKWKNCSEFIYNKKILLSDDGYTFSEALSKTLCYEFKWTLIDVEIPFDFLGEDYKDNKSIFIKATFPIDKLFPIWIISANYNPSIYVDIFYQNFGVCNSDINLDVDPGILLFNYFKSLKLKVFS